VSAALRVIAPGFSSTLQDRGRVGWLRLGVPSSGALDPRALAMANVLVGNGTGEGALELTLFGGAFAVEGAAVRIAVAGADMAMTIDGAAAATGRSHTLAPGSVLRLGTARRGIRAYLALAGGFTATPRFGSVATHLRSGIGRALGEGDVLPLAGEAPTGPERRFAAPPPHVHPRARVVLGPQDDHFSRDAIDALLGGDYRVTQEADRMGLRLDGPPLAHSGGFNIISDAIAPGSIQVPGNGQPIVLLADRQTTGGYPKIATVISVDVPALGQARPGDFLRFEAVSLDAAVEARRALLAWFDALPAGVMPISRLDSEGLLGANLISGVTDGAG
jgi:5-oxoprolinase (ATP-hydrolysing) subunit C